MKKINIITQAILFVAIIVLFFLHFKGKCGISGSSANDTSSVAKINSSIAYVNIDSLIAKYQMTIDLSSEIQSKGKQLDADLSSKSKNFQASVQDLQYKAQKGLEVRSKLEEMQQKLAAEEQNLYKLRDSYTQQMQEENSVMLRKVMNNVMEYLKEYNKGKNFHYILGNTFDGKILFADESLNITNDVLKGLNEHYASTKKDSKK
jgi:outer membrane protein